uniref:Histone acetyltransferase n=1 Tax=Rhizophora mucronata TaxID=61149 RepID=A0A2P2KDT6_RHIMU
MGSIDTPTNLENGSKRPNDGEERFQPPADEMPPAAMDTTPTDSDPSKRRRAGVMPLEVGTRVMCRWRDGKYHPVKVIERRRMQSGGPNDYEYYVHYTEFNRRLDEWVKLDQLDLDSVETVVDEKVEDKVTGLKMTRHQKRKIDETHVEVWFSVNSLRICVIIFVIYYSKISKVLAILCHIGNRNLLSTCWIV